jgi:hypothetical protein
MKNKIFKPAPPKASVAKKEEKKPPAEAIRKKIKFRQHFFKENPVTFDIVADEEIEYSHHTKLIALVFSQSIALAILAILLIVLIPFMEPIYHYYARDPAGEEVTMNALIVPNMTNRAVISWAVTSVTEIMTIGFGDLFPQLQAQNNRFTGEGWKSFVEAFRKQQIRELFKGHQIVLTTAPSDTAVILAQGPNKQGVYQWKVQVPVIMTYATNNNVSQGHHAIVTLIIVRAPPDQNPSGVAIKKILVD